MPVFNDENQSRYAIPGSAYQFSAARIDRLGATEYTLAVVVLDVSGSTASLRPEMERALRAIVEACHQSPRADTMMLRVVLFDDEVRELHGFEPLPGCHPADYDGCLRGAGGLTALFDACYTAIQSAARYGEHLTANDFDVNAAVFVVTDGLNNRGSATEGMVKQALSDAVTGEHLESITSVLVGLNSTGQLDRALKQLEDRCGFSQYVGIADATAAELAKLADFISRSVSAQSQALGTGGPSQVLVF